ncbi:MAG: HD domain-containing protein [Candidatus Micrarchaeales archaeon]|jgi:putative hydrolase of HD superfamily
MNNKELDRILEFMLKVSKVKGEKRSGWLINKIPSEEHVADHMFSTALLSYIFGKRKKLDADRCVEMALIHDIHEAITGDIATRAKEEDQKVTNNEKKRLGHIDTMTILSYLPKNEARSVHELWNEYEAQKTKEAKLVDQIDKLDYIIQAIVYSKKVKDKKKFKDFFITAERKIKDPELLYIYERAKKIIL